MARRGNFCRRRRALRGDRVGWLGAALSVPGEGEAVHAEGVGDEVEVLALVADAVGSAEPEGVVEVPVDGFGVVASFVERGEVQVGHGDGSDVLGAVEPASGVFVGAVEPDGDGAGAEAWREAVTAHPATRRRPASAVAANQGDPAAGSGVNQIAYTDSHQRCARRLAGPRGARRRLCSTRYQRERPGEPPLAGTSASHRSPHF